MDDSNNNLVETAVRPFSDNAELKLSATVFLRNRLMDQADTAATIARWDAVDTRKRKSIKPLSLWAAMVLVSMGVICIDCGEISRVVQWRGWSEGRVYMLEPPPDTMRHLAGKLNASDRLLVLGRFSQKKTSERKEALWRSEPENPSYYADYAAAFIHDNDRLPPDFLETARRIDPTNAWFSYLAAAVESKGAVEEIYREGKQVGSRWVHDTPQTWEIRDQARLDRALTILGEARNQPKCTNYFRTLMRKRLPLLPRGSLFESLESDRCLDEITVWSTRIRIRYLADVIAAETWSLSEADDIQGFREIYQDGDLFLRRLCSDEAGDLWDDYGKSVCAERIADNFAFAMEKLGIKEDSSHWKNVADLISNHFRIMDRRKFIIDGNPVESDTYPGGFLGTAYTRSAGVVRNQPPVTAAELKPLRLLDHEALSRLYSYVSWVLMMLCLGCVACYRFRVSVLSRRMAQRMECLLVSADWGWIIGLGVVLPFVYVMAVNRLTPLGGRELGALDTAMLMPAGHFLGLWILWLVLPVLIVRWRLAKRAGRFGFSGPSWIDGPAVVCAAAFVPMIGWAAISGLKGHWPGALMFDPADAQLMPWMFWAAAALVVVSLLWVMGRIFLAIFGRADQQFYRATLALILVRAHAVILIVIALSTLGFKVTTQYWFKEAKSSRFNVPSPGWNTFEYKVAVQMRKELREVLGYDR